MPGKPTVRIVMGTTTAKVFSPFEAKECIRTLPKQQRNWDPEEKCWVISIYAVRDLRAALQYEGFTVLTLPRGEDQSGAPRPRRQHADTWADLMYAQLGATLAGKAYKALLGVLHPDRGGDTEAMKVLNAARDRAAVSR
ncbi:hypothetical protein [Streptomyces sp. ME19-01-6]|uniref:hypothetical protein n=1 Tax=Streptomyces sp. ME19-01-6 TaxID=3028686 RepID=UPI0029B8C04F|nr:hypothetical protein [Streptomyces sp. ME19-01-6]MDX3229403.1 hypothetical protein [Streptomyces sp. ME19-01-6]